MHPICPVIPVLEVGGCTQASWRSSDPIQPPNCLCLKGSWRLSKRSVVPGGYASDCGVYAKILVVIHKFLEVMGVVLGIELLWQLKKRKCRECIFPFPHSLSISSPFHHSLHFLFIFSFSLHFLAAWLPGCQAATSCATLVQAKFRS